MASSNFCCIFTSFVYGFNSFNFFIFVHFNFLVHIFCKILFLLKLLYFWKKNKRKLTMFWFWKFSMKKNIPGFIRKYIKNRIWLLKGLMGRYNKKKNTKRLYTKILVIYMIFRRFWEPNEIFYFFTQKFLTRLTTEFSKKNVTNRIYAKFTFEWYQKNPILISSKNFTVNDAKNSADVRIGRRPN